MESNPPRAIASDSYPTKKRIVVPLQSDQTILNGKYRILHLIGEGGMARVWLAEDVHFDRQVAIKEPHAGLGSTDSEELSWRFHREVKVSAALANDKTPNCVLFEMLTGQKYKKHDPETPRAP